VAANAHLVQQYKRLNLEFFLRMNADLTVMVRQSVGTLSTPTGKRVWLCNGCKALTSCKKQKTKKNQLHRVAICDDITVMLALV